MSAGEKRCGNSGYRLAIQSARMRSARSSTGPTSQSVLSRSKQIARMAPNPWVPVFIVTGYREGTSGRTAIDHRQQELLVLVIARVDSPEKPRPAIHRARVVARYAGIRTRHRRHQPDAARAGARSRQPANLGFARHLRVRLRTRRARLARGSRGARHGTRGLGGNAFRVRDAALAMADERARHRTAHATRRRPRRRYRAYRRRLAGLSAPLRRAWSLAVRRIQCRGRDVHARRAAIPHVRSSDAPDIRRILGYRAGRHAPARLARGRGRGKLDHRIFRDWSLGLEIDMKSSLRVAAACALTLGLQVQADAAGGRAFTPTDLNTLARVSDPQVSPNNRYVVYVQRETDLEANRGRNDLWMVDLEAKPLKPRRLTQHSENDTNPRWSVDGTSIYFLSTRAGSSQIWRLPMSGGEAVQITDFPLDVGSFKFSSGGGRIALTMDVFRDCADLKCTRERLDNAKTAKVSVREYGELF